ncbi:MAG TPA: xanthine dehydrogenase family protein molybdopterin-binding subunit [Candidatus Acidoferrales bacterium]|jgi:isoquinoline 1-oxidoreductase beta subunit|nr:xanthine dehydrogenase family protein molybdopterin-binding subunit [Candidatus Acidoferrales bacterium]
MAKSTAFSRREFLRTGVAGGAALVVGFRLSRRAFANQAAEQEKKTPSPFDAWVRITPDNRVTLILGKSEMGQGIMTALPMILAEELCVDWKSVKVEQAPTNPKIYDLGTGGSGSVAGSWLPLRRAGAAAREMLIAAAAQKWEVGADTCKAVDGQVVHGNPRRYLSYGELVEAAAKLPIPNFNTVPLKNSNDFTLVGHDTRRYEVREKAIGTAVFGIDSRLPGMLFAVVARCPVFGGKVVSFDAAKAKAVPGVRDVIAFETSGRGASTTGGIAVLAVNSWAAIQGRKALEVKWDLGPAAKESSAGLHEQFLANAARPGKIVRNDGDADAALASSPKKIEAAYEFPFAAHACMEPMNCTVHIRPDGADAWVPTQAPQWAQGVIAEAAKLPPEKVIVHTTLMGGGFGRRYQADFVMEAAQVAKAAGKPVMVLWTREDDMQHDFYRPASYHKMQGALDANGNLAAWKHFQTSTSIAAKWRENGAEKPEQGEFGTGSTIPYVTPNIRIEYTLAESSVPRAWWRSVEHSTSGFVVESFIDELAAAAGQDPLAFRMKLIGADRKIPLFDAEKEPSLDTARLKGVLQLAAEKAGWAKPLPKEQGRGIAAFYSFDSYTAAVAEVSVKNGAVKLERLVYAVDCGRPINPEGVRAQVESAAIYGLSAASYDAITISGGRVEQSNFNDYQMPRMNDAPKTEVHVVMSKEEPTGIGEPGLPVVAPAMCNAIFAATGKRLRRLPIQPRDLA